MLKTKVVRLPSGRKLVMLIGQRLTPKMLAALDEQNTEMRKGR